MKYLIILMTFFSSLVTGNVCDIYPEGYEVVNTWSRNGVLTIVDRHGNGVDIYVDTRDVDVDAEVSLHKRNSQLKGGGHLIRFEVFDQPYPVDTLIVIPGRGFTVSANLLKLGEPSTHGVFERNVISMMRRIARGGQNEKVWIDCFGALFESVGFASGEGRPVDASAV